MVFSSGPRLPIVIDIWYIPYAIGLGRFVYCWALYYIAEMMLKAATDYQIVLGFCFCCLSIIKLSYSFVLNVGIWSFMATCTATKADSILTIMCVWWWTFNSWSSGISLCWCILSIHPVLSVNICCECEQKHFREGESRNGHFIWAATF